MVKSRFSYLKLAAVVAILAMTIIAGVLLVHGHSNPPENKFAMKDATTRENNGRRVRAKQGFELVKDGNNVSARRLNKPTERANNSYACRCGDGKAEGCEMTISTHGGDAACSGNACCDFVIISQ